MMKLNLGALDRWIRIAGGAFVFSLGFWGPQTNWAWLGLLVAFTGLIGHCPIYTMLGLSSCPRGRDSGGREHRS